MKLALGLAAACAAVGAGCGDEGPTVLRSPSNAAPEPPPPTWCDGGVATAEIRGALPPALLGSVPRGQNGFLCPAGTRLATEPVAGAEPEISYFCERPERPGVPHGRWRSFWGDGGLQAERSFADGERDGMWRAFYPNGEPWFELRYRRGQRHGVQREWYPGHQLRLEIGFEAGQPAGRWRHWNRRGDVVCQVEQPSGAAPSPPQAPE
jgi:hypothetical protein